MVRTLSGRRFSELGGESEKGILEAYLRAFAAAESYIYLENQYFTDSVITDALVEVLKKKPKLELILVVPIKPDVIFYPRRQARRIDAAPGGRRRSGRRLHPLDLRRETYPSVGRAGLHPRQGRRRRRLVGHRRVGQPRRALARLQPAAEPAGFRRDDGRGAQRQRDPAGTRARSPPFAELMRRRLFAEHLGLVDVDGVPNPDDPALDHDPAVRAGSELWRPTAQRALEHVPRQQATSRCTASCSSTPRRTAAGSIRRASTWPPSESTCKPSEASCGRSRALEGSTSAAGSGTKPPSGRTSSSERRAHAARGRRLGADGRRVDREAHRRPARACWPSSAGTSRRRRRHRPGRPRPGAGRDAADDVVDTRGRSRGIDR